MKNGDEAKIDIHQAHGDVIISQNQQGGTTSHTVVSKESKSKSKKKWTFVGIITFIGSILTILAYFGLTPIFKNKTHKTVENKENQQTIAEKNRAFAKENTEVTKRIHKEQKMFDKKEDKQISVGAVSGNVIISQNQSGGITANQVNIGSLPRSISSDSELLFIKEINNFPTKNNNITIRTYLGDAECQNLSIAIKNSFEKAGWTIKGHLYEVPNQPVRNVVLGVPMSDKESKTALIIYNWLNLNNLKTTAELVPDEKGYIIFVGQNL